MRKDKHYDFIFGEVLLFNKPLEWTSFDVVNKVRGLLSRHLKTRRLKVGHAGTLDPLATGLLIVCTGKATKKLNEFQLLEKEYQGTFTLGATTPSLDLETEIDQRFEFSHITKEMIKEAAEKFTGKIKQTPPAFSAKRVHGEKAYIKARKGEQVILKSCEITIREFDILRTDLPEVDFRVVCSKGTYIRSLASDFGKALCSGAYLSRLCRTKIGEFNLLDAFEIETFEAMLAECRVPIK